MRKCLRCGTEMKENCAIKVEGAGYGIVMSSDENKLFGGRIGKPKVAICPKCGEVANSGLLRPVLRSKTAAMRS